jgi:hypothetical protein
MRRTFIVTACVLVTTVGAGAADWPDRFTLQCGDVRHKQPFDPNDARGTLVPMFTGEAVRMAPGELPGAYAKGLGYKLTMALTDETLTGTREPVSLSFTCQTRDSNATGFDNKMTCSSSLRALPAVPGFNMITASLSVPGLAIQPGNQPQNTVSVRRQVREETPGTQILRYYQAVREMSCVYAR